MKIKMMDILFFSLVLFIFISLFVLNGCANDKKELERISITGTHPVTIEQDYVNHDGNIKYSSKIEINRKNLTDK